MHGRLGNAAQCCAPPTRQKNDDGLEVVRTTRVNDYVGVQDGLRPQQTRSNWHEEKEPRGGFEGPCQKELKLSRRRCSGLLGYRIDRWNRSVQTAFIPREQSPEYEGSRQLRSSAVNHSDR